MTTGINSRCVAGTATRLSFSSSSCSSVVSPLRGEGDDRAAARLGFLDVALHFLEDVIVRGDRDHRHLLVDERDRAVLHLAGGIALGVNVGNFLQLERAFEGDRVERCRVRGRGSPIGCEDFAVILRFPSRSCVSSRTCGRCISPLMDLAQRLGLRTCRAPRRGRAQRARARRAAS